MSFAEVAGHEEAVRRLRRSTADERPASAYLLHGPAGIGKRRLGDALAMRLLCAAPKDDDACGTCGQCTRVAAGTHPDLRVVVRDADRRDIRTEQIRELTRWLGLRPLMAERKVAVIDGAECLNEHGQNALLKTLEEPPGASVLILVAARASLLLPTVRSRCQQLRLDPLPTAVVERLLGERDVDPARAAVLAARAEGSPGRALGLADEAHGAIRDELLERLPQLRDLTAAELSALAQTLGKTAPEAALEIVTSWYRDLLGVVVGSTPRGLRNPDAATGLQAAAARTDADAVLRQLETVCDTIDAITRNANRVLAFETMLLALRRIERGPDRNATWTNAR